MEFQVRLRGRGRVEVAAYGVADAEHLVEKEIRRLWPDARVEVLDISRTEARSRVVEEFRVAYLVTATLTVTAPTKEEAPSAAFRHARGLLSGSRYRRTEWERTTVPGA